MRLSTRIFCLLLVLILCVFPGCASQDVETLPTVTIETCSPPATETTAAAETIPETAPVTMPSAPEHSELYIPGVSVEDESRLVTCRKP